MAIIGLILIHARKILPLLESRLKCVSMSAGLNSVSLLSFFDDTWWQQSSERVKLLKLLKRVKSTTSVKYFKLYKSKAQLIKTCVEFFLSLITLLKYWKHLISYLQTSNSPWKPFSLICVSSLFVVRFEILSASIDVISSF